MLSLLQFIISTVGLTFIVTQSKLFKPLRDFCTRIHKGIGYFFGCPMCFGLWSGVIVYFIQIYKIEIIIYGLIGSFLSYTAYLILSPLMKKYD